MGKERILSGIDIGSSKVATIIASIEEEQTQIIGVSSVPSLGVKKGVIVDIDEAVDAIAQSLEAAERMAGYAVSQAFVSVNGQHISSVNSQGVVAVSNPNNEIGEDDISRVIEAARAISLPSSREIVHVVPRSYIVDSQEGVSDPIGMSGVRLQVETHIVTGATTTMRNLVKCIQQVGVDIEALVFSGLAASGAVLSETEKELGVILLDIGAGVSDLVLFTEGSPSYSAVLPVGGKNISNDLAVGLRVSLEDAERIKLLVSQYKEAVLPEEQKDKKQVGFEKDEELDISELGIEGLASIDKKFLREGIVRPRLEEIFDLVAKEIKKSGLDGFMPSGIVICGGAANTLGINDVARKVLRLPVRIGVPGGVSGLIDEVETAAYAGSIGLIKYGVKEVEKTQRGSRIPLIERLPINRVKEAGGKAISWVKSWMP